jgi:hypothetical protein
MARTILLSIILPALLAPASGFAAAVDVFVSKQVEDVSGDPCDGGAVHTRARLSASANLYRSDRRPPTITTRAWIWTLPESLDPAGYFSPLPGGDPPGSEIHAWADPDRRTVLLDTAGVRVLEMPGIEAVPGMMSRWSTSPDGEWAVAVTPSIVMDTVIARPHIQRTGTGAESGGTVVRSLPAVHLAGGESRVLRIPAAPGDDQTAVFLELRSNFGWEGTPPKVRQRTYTDSWTDRVGVGGQLEVEGVYTNGAFPGRRPR